MINIFAFRPDLRKKGELVLYYVNSVLTHEALFNLRIQDINFNATTRGQTHNFSYTIGDCPRGSSRNEHKRDIIAYDIDHTDNDMIDQYIDIIARVTGTDPDRAVTVNSGNGLHYIIYRDTPIFVSFYDKYKPYYIESCLRIQEALKAHGLPAKVDKGIWKKTTLLRMPGTINSKPMHVPLKDAENVKPCFIYRGKLQKQTYDLEKFLPGHTKETNEIGEFEHDPDFVTKECRFLAKQLADGGANADEPEWYAFLGTVGHLTGGEALAHKGSELHPGYEFNRCQKKLDQAITTAPRTCAHISTVSMECITCPYNGKIHSPMSLIEGRIKWLEQAPIENGESKEQKENPDEVVDWEQEFKADLEAGFTFELEKGKLLRDYPRAISYASKVLQIKIIPEMEKIYRWDEGYYKQITDLEVRGLFNRLFSASKPPAVKEVTEALGRFMMQSEEMVPWAEFSKLNHCINLNNGVYNIETDTLEAHSEHHYFLYKLDYDYDPSATCPTFDRFIEYMSMGDPNRKETLLQFGGYCLNSGDTTYQKFLVLDGAGSNGKTTYLRALKNVLGASNYTEVSIMELQGTKHSTPQIVGKKLNVCEEENRKCFSDTGMLKRLTSFDDILINEKMEKTYLTANTAKIIMTYNIMPYLNDDSLGMRRRMMVVRCLQNYEVNLEARIPDIDNKLLAERAGIFNALMRAYRRLKQAGGFKHDVDTQKRYNQMLRDSDDIASFIHQHIVYTGNDIDRIPMPTLREHFADYIGVNAASKYNNVQFGKRVISYIRSLGHNVEVAALKNKNRITENVLKGVVFKQCPPVPEDRRPATFEDFGV